MPQHHKSVTHDHLCSVWCATSAKQHPLAVVVTARSQRGIPYEENRKNLGRCFGSCRWQRWLCGFGRSRHDDEKGSYDDEEASQEASHDEENDEEVILKSFNERKPAELKLRAFLFSVSK